jgi:hypothetical protein
MARQRQLERCNWVFWRVSESNFRFDSEKAMSSLWRKLDDLGIHPLAPSAPASRSDSPPFGDRQAPPPKATRASSSHPGKQMDLMAPPQLELDAQARESLSPKPESTNALTAESPIDVVVAKVKRARLNGFFTRDEICKVVLAFLQVEGRMERKNLAGKVVAALGLPEHHDKRVENAFEALDQAGKVSLGVETVCLVQA